MIDLEEYEKVYLDRIAKTDEEKEAEDKKNKQIEKKEVSKLLKNLDHADYTLLESQRTTNILL